MRRNSRRPFNTGFVFVLVRLYRSVGFSFLFCGCSWFFEEGSVVVLWGYRRMWAGFSAAPNLRPSRAERKWLRMCIVTKKYVKKEDLFRVVRIRTDTNTFRVTLDEGSGRCVGGFSFWLIVSCQILRT